MPILDAESLEFISRNATQTQRLGERLGALLQGGDTLALVGELGTGKTVFAQGVGKGWGALSLLTSPSFVLIRRHERPQNTLKLYHVDLYRLDSLREVRDLGLEELLGDLQAICIVEWAGRATEVFPEECLWVTLRGLDESRRSLIFRAGGQRHQDLLQQFRKEIIGR
ncbi:MAG: tRNA (adenosine(37)-N6)-threonylcarbamoyltransferase complex ATPase subunit type 1 TsaE [Chloroflexota bacterium]|nr:tRNA (adenosine(37)-N6)-threonylcarbamoyltransferase complex ATPase subunit type 1 TsaE [Chloroflexota bacterium]